MVFEAHTMNTNLSTPPKRVRCSRLQPCWSIETGCSSLAHWLHVTLWQTFEAIRCVPSITAGPVVAPAPWVVRVLAVPFPPCSDPSSNMWVHSQIMQALVGQCSSCFHHFRVYLYLFAKFRAGQHSVWYQLMHKALGKQYIYIYIYICVYVHIYWHPL